MGNIDEKIEDRELGFFNNNYVVEVESVELLTQLQMLMDVLKKCVT